MTDGASNGYVLQSDASGNGTWATIASTSVLAGNGLSYSGTTLNSVWTSANGGIVHNNTGSKIGISTTSPYCMLANTATNIYGADGQGLNAYSLGWSQNATGYTGAFFNSSTNVGAQGLAVKIAGTSSTNRLLDLSTDIQSDYAGTSVMVVQGDGKVGIGTSSPSNKLDIQSSSSVTGSVQSSASSAYLKVVAPSGNETALNFSTYSAGSSSNRWVFGKSTTSESGSNAGSDFFINRYSDAGAYVAQPFKITRSNGYVGIGLSSTPSTQLEVSGTTKTTNLQMTNGATSGYVLKSDASGNGSWVTPSSAITAGTGLAWSGSTLNGVFTTSGANIYSNNTGNVGIGVTSPTNKLEVSGTTKTTNLQMTNGATSGYVLKSDASGNGSWVAASTLTTATPTAIKDADANTKVEVEQSANEDKIRFTLGGTEYYKMNKGAIEFNNTGNSVFLGASAGTADDYSANNNVGIGDHCLSTNTTGDANTALGYYALNLNTASQNTAIGYQALQNNSTGNYNTALGYQGAKATTSGSYNIAIGYRALKANTTSDNNISIGAYSGYQSTGSENVFIGPYAGFDNIGGSNKLYIENGNVSSEPLIYGDFSTGQVGFGTNSVTHGQIEITGSLTYPTNNVNYGYLNGNGNTGSNNTSSTPYSLYADSRIGALQFNAFSDARIKKVVRRTNNEEDLKTIMGLQITDYTYIDTIAKGNKVFKKVIAQEVDKIYPMAVSKSSEFVPNLYRVCSINNGFVAYANADVKAGDKVKLILDKRTVIVEVKSVNDQGFYVNAPQASLPLGTASSSVFVYGKEVNDFHTVDYEALSTLNISATQELVKQVNDLKAQNEQLQSDNATMKTDIEALKAAIFKKEY
jgi:hypothetical protein